MTNVFIISRDQSFRRRLEIRLLKERIQILRVYETYEESVKNLFEHSQPDICICSSEAFQSNQSSAKKGIAEISRYSNILIIFDDTSIDNASFFMETKVRGMILKSEIDRYLLPCITTVENGGVFLTPKIKDSYIKSGLSKANKANNNFLEKLTLREKEIVKLILDFKTNKEISKELFISYQTVKNHRYQIMKKFNLKGRGKLLQFLIENRDSFKS